MIMTKAEFVDDTTINVVVRDGETFTVKTFFPTPTEEQQKISNFLAHYFENNFSDDKTSMVYWVLMDCMANQGFSFFSATGDRSKERKRIGARIRELREEKSIEAKHLATLANIDAANLSRIESGSYSIGLDILSRIAHVLGARVDLV